MSKTSRLTSHRNEGHPVLFHSGLGTTNPVSRYLSVAMPSDDAGLEELRRANSALLHERHHWLQIAGTSAGVFHSLLMEIQAGLLAGNVPLRELEPADLPLLAGRFGEHPALFRWECLEAVRRIFWGCRPGDLDALREAGRMPTFPFLAEHMGELLKQVAGDREETAEYLARAWGGDHRRPEQQPLMVKHRGWGLGARHVMEDSARLSEVLRLAAYGDPVDARQMFSGPYGLLRAGFYDFVEQEQSGTGELVFSYLCDKALHLMYPPAFPPSGRFVGQDWNPATRLLHLALDFRDFDFRRPVNVLDPAAVREFTEELDDHLGEQYRYVARAQDESMARAFGHMDADGVAQTLYVLGEDGLPGGSGPPASPRYTLALHMEALRIRRENPEFFALPVCRYLHDRDAFRALFNAFPPPLLVYGERGAGTASAPREQWLVFFLDMALQSEALRSAVMYDADGIAARLAPYVRDFAPGGDALGLAEMSVRSLFGAGAVGGRIVDGLRARMAGTG